MNPVGKGQESPNINPYLPPPVGRLRLTANPLMMVKQLVGRQMCLRLLALGCCISCVMFIGIFGSTIMSTLTFYEEMEHPGGSYQLPSFPYAFNTTSASPTSDSEANDTAASSGQDAEAT